MTRCIHHDSSPCRHEADADGLFCREHCHMPTPAKPHPQRRATDKPKPRVQHAPRQEVRVNFCVIVADCPWAYRNMSDACHGAAVAHYNTMPYKDIAAIPVASFAAPDCVLAMWGTWPKLDEGIDLVRAWGFNYVTGFPWVKTQPSSREIYTGIGFWKQSVSEFLLIGRRGEPTRRAPREPGLGFLVSEPRVFYAPRGEHSAKPEEVQDWLAREFDGPYLELFARRERTGWSTWGNEVGFKLSAEGVAACPLPAPAPLPLFDRGSP